MTATPDAFWPSGLAVELDAVCDRFERAWQAARAGAPRPRIEAFLETASGDARQILLRELLELEIAYARMAGETLSAADYESRFPDATAVIRDVLPPTGAAPTTAPPGVPGLEPTGFYVPPDSDQTNMYAGPGGPGRAPAAPPERPADSGPVVIADYEILGELGRGGMGVVYKARQRSLKRVVALKMILAGGMAGPRELERFRIEAESIARLKHPNFVQVYEIGTHDRHPYFSLEFVDGRSLDRQLDRTPQPPTAAARLAEVLARAMEHAHRQHLVHRDLKPANVLVAADGTPKITDFGLAKQLDEDGLTNSGAIMGTPSYMAPEQAAGRVRDITNRTDVYALGAILYEMLTGQVPFKGETPFDTVLLVQEQDPVPPRRTQPKVPADLETICLTCLHKDPGRRYASAEALADDLARFLAGKPILARPVGRLEQAWKWARRRPWEAATFGTSAAVVLLLGLGALLVQQQQLKEQRQQLKELERVERARADVQGQTRSGDEAARSGDWQKARVCYTRAKTAATDIPALGDEEAALDGKLAEAERHIKEQQDKAESEEQLRQFDRFADEAQFRELLFASDDPDAAVQATRSAARAALDLFQVRADGDTLPALGPQFDSRRTSEISARCYALLLVEADAVSKPRAAAGEAKQTQARAALGILDRAARLAKDAGLSISQSAVHTRRAHYLEAAGDTAAAKDELARAGPPRDALDFFLLAGDRFHHGDNTGAVRACDQVLRAEPNNFWAELIEAACYLRLQRWDAAKTCLNACLSRRPEFAWAYLWRGYAYTFLDDAAAAENDFAEALRRQPDSLTRYAVYLNRSLLYIREGRTNPGRYDAAVADLLEAIALKPKQFNGYVNLAQVYEGQRRIAEAVAQMDTAIGLNPGLPALYRTRARLVLHLPKPDTEAAGRDLDKAIALEAPGRRSLVLAEDYLERGRLLHRAGKLTEAIAAYDQATAERPDYAPPHRLRAEALIALRRDAEAAEAIDCYLKNHGPPLPEVYRARGLLRAKAGDYGGAIDDYTQSLKLAPDHVETLLFRGWAHLASESARLALPDFERALTLARHAVAEHPGPAGEALVGCASCRARQVHGYRQAVGEAEEALRLAPPTARLLANAGRVYALAAARVEPERSRSEPAGGSTRARYQERAVRLLREAVAATPADQRPGLRRELRADPALQAVRNVSGFKKLLSE